MTKRIGERISVRRPPTAKETYRPMDIVVHGETNLEHTHGIKARVKLLDGSTLLQTSTATSAQELIKSLGTPTAGSGRKQAYLSGTKPPAKAAMKHKCMNKTQSINRFGRETPNHYQGSAFIGLPPSIVASPQLAMNGFAGRSQARTEPLEVALSILEES